MTDWDTSCRDWRRRIVAGETLIPRLPLYKPRADKAERIFRRLRLTKVRGAPTMGEACRPFVFDLVRAIFGAYDPLARRQVIRELMLLIAKKNGKSSISAGIMLTALIMNEVRGGEYLILAPTKDVADNSFEPALGMIEADKALAARFKPMPVTREIENRLDGANLAVKAADAESVGGRNPISVLVDELWLLGKRAQAENILSEATGSLVSQPEGFVVFLTTQSDTDPAGVFRKKLDYHRKVRDGTIADHTVLPVLYEFPEDMVKDSQVGANDAKWRDPANWGIPNPNLGRSVDLQWLVSKYHQYELEGADSLRIFAAKHFNIEVGVGIGLDSWAGAEHWEYAAKPEICGSLAELCDRCEVIVIGIDGGGLDDLLGLTVLGRERSVGEVTTKRWLLWSHAWASREVLRRRKSIATKLEDLGAAEQLEIVDHIGEDIAGLQQLVDEVRETGLLPDRDAIGIDPVAIGQIVDALKEIGITDDQIVAVTQGWKLAGAIKTAERKLADGTLVHAGQELMAWSVGNAKLEQRGNAILITKQASGFAKIDPLMAAFNAIALMTLAPEAKRSVYEDRGERPILVL